MILIKIFLGIEKQIKLIRNNYDVLKITYYFMKLLIFFSLIVPILANEVKNYSDDTCEKILIFDIDHTLYPISLKTGVKKIFTQAFIDFISQYHNEELSNIDIARIKKKSNSSSSYNALYNEFRINKTYFDDFFISTDKYSFDQVVKFDYDLKNALENLKFRGYRIFCLTNGYYLQAKNTLEALQLEDLVELTISYDIFTDSVLRKPLKEAYKYSDYIFRNFNDLSKNYFHYSKYINFEMAKEIYENNHNFSINSNKKALISFYDNENRNLKKDTLISVGWTGFHIKTDNCLMEFISRL